MTKESEQKDLLTVKNWIKLEKYASQKKIFYLVRNLEMSSKFELAMGHGRLSCNFSRKNRFRSKLTRHAHGRESTGSAKITAGRRCF